MPGHMISTANLVVVPQEQSFEGIDLAKCGLTELPVLEEHGLIWVRPVPVVNRSTVVHI